MSDSGSNEYMSDDEIKYNGEDDEHRHENDDSGCALDKLAVSFDQEEEEDEDEDGQIPTRSLWIGNVDPTLSPADLLALFAPYGRVESLRILVRRVEKKGIEGV